MQEETERAASMTTSSIASADVSVYTYGVCLCVCASLYFVILSVTFCVRVYGVFQFDVNRRLFQLFVSIFYKFSSWAY
jgi:hypothetical protein